MKSLIRDAGFWGIRIQAPHFSPSAMRRLVLLSDFMNTGNERLSTSGKRFTEDLLNVLNLSAKTSRCAVTIIQRDVGKHAWC